MAIVTARHDSVGASPAQRDSWQDLLRTAIRDPLRLCRILELPGHYELAAVRAAKSFPVFAPWSFIDRMQRGNAHDPLLRQVLPLGEECEAADGYSTDPLGEARAARGPGLLQKYDRRVLLVTTAACAVHCRYCFRRHYPYSPSAGGIQTWNEALGWIRADESIEEVLLSGGDPLTLVDEQLAELAERLANISHLRRLRVHTRLPIVIPQRVTDSLVAWLRGTRLTPIVVVHANHPAELDGQVGQALGRLLEAGIPLLNQAVLLRGVNDDVDTLAELSSRLVDLRVMPYYLHQLDRVLGAAHFEVPTRRGRALIHQLRARLPGYAVPRYVQEVLGHPGKRVLD